MRSSGAEKRSSLSPDSALDVHKGVFRRGSRDRASVLSSVASSLPAPKSPRLPQQPTAIPLSAQRQAMDTAEFQLNMNMAYYANSTAALRDRMHSREVQVGNHAASSSPTATAATTATPLSAPLPDMSTVDRDNTAKVLLQESDEKEESGFVRSTSSDASFGASTTGENFENIEELGLFEMDDDEQVIHSKTHVVQDVRENTAAGCRYLRH